MKPLIFKAIVGERKPTNNLFSLDYKYKPHAMKTSINCGVNCTFFPIKPADTSRNASVNVSRSFTCILLYEVALFLHMVRKQLLSSALPLAGLAAAPVRKNVPRLNNAPRAFITERPMRGAIRHEAPRKHVVRHKHIARRSP